VTVLAWLCVASGPLVSCGEHPPFKWARRSTPPGGSTIVAYLELMPDDSLQCRDAIKRYTPEDPAYIQAQYRVYTTYRGWLAPLITDTNYIFSIQDLTIDARLQNAGLIDDPAFRVQVVELLRSQQCVEPLQLSNRGAPPRLLLPPPEVATSKHARISKPLYWGYAYLTAFAVSFVYLTRPLWRRIKRTMTRRSSNSAENASESGEGTAR
jgi:hypothetical protein